MAKIAGALRGHDGLVVGMMFFKGRRKVLAAQKLKMIVHRHCLRLMVQVLHGSGRMGARHSPETLVLHPLDF